MSTPDVRAILADALNDPRVPDALVTKNHERDLLDVLTPAVEALLHNPVGFPAGSDMVEFYVSDGAVVLFCLICGKDLPRNANYLNEAIVAWRDHCAEQRRTSRVARGRPVGPGPKNPAAEAKP